MPFQDVVGHGTQIGLLRNAILSESVSHAYLFYGPAGIGKKKVSEIFAQALNCEKKDGDACGQCRSCRNIQSGNHPDVLYLQPEEDYIRIEEIRKVQKNLGYKAFEGRWKIAILDGCEEMSVGASNAFLKTLEEPPARTSIILICANYLSLLPTIFSRCQRIRFKPLHDNQIKDILLTEKGVEPEKACAVAALSGGSLGAALSMDYQETIDLRNEAFDLVSKTHGGDMVNLFAQGKKISGLKEDLKELLDRMLVLVRDLAVVQTSGRTEFVKNKDISPQIKEFSGKINPDATQEMFEAIQETRVSLQRHANPQLAMDNLLIKIKGLLSI